jgi:hypothetical protein
MSPAAAAEHMPVRIFGQTWETRAQMNAAKIMHATVWETRAQMFQQVCCCHQIRSISEQLDQVRSVSHQNQLISLVKMHGVTHRHIRGSIVLLILIVCSIYCNHLLLRFATFMNGTARPSYSNHLSIENEKRMKTLPLVT